MLNEDQEKNISELYIEYQQEIKLLMFYVEHKYHKFPKGLLKEFRDVFDHISRCYVDDADEDYINQNITKAQNHFERIKLDVYKYLNDYKSKEFDRWKRKYNRYELQNINDGEFWKQIVDWESDSELLQHEARKIEPKDVKKACDLRSEATKRYESIFELVKEKQDLIRKVKFNYIRASVGNIIIGFILGIIASIVANWLYTEVPGIIQCLHL